jgi:nucleotide-binding universal stress UspA family protein
MAVTEVVAGVDGSPGSEEAFVWALHEARLRNLPLRAVTAWLPSGEPEQVERLAALKSVAELRDRLGRELAATVRTLMQRSAVADVRVTTVVEYGHPAEKLIRTAGTGRLLVVGSRGRGGIAGALLGSVSQNCAQYAHVPVIVVRGRQADDGAKRVVVGVDGSAASHSALRFAAEEAALRKAVLHVVHAWTPPYVGYGSSIWSPAVWGWDELEAQARSTVHDSLRRVLADAAGVAVEESLVEGSAGAALLTAATGADLLVVGSRGRGGWKGLLLGSVSMHCITHAPCPVAVARDTDTVPEDTA